MKELPPSYLPPDYVDSARGRGRLQLQGRLQWHHKRELSEKPVSLSISLLFRCTRIVLKDITWQLVVYFDCHVS